MHLIDKRSRSNPNFIILLLPSGSLWYVAISPQGAVVICCMTGSPSSFLLEYYSTVCKKVLVCHCLVITKAIGQPRVTLPRRCLIQNPQLQFIPPSWVLKYSLRQC